jgi:hypothetical protein
MREGEACGGEPTEQPCARLCGQASSRKLQVAQVGSAMHVAVLLSNLHQSDFFFYKLLCLFHEMQDAMYI